MVEFSDYERNLIGFLRGHEYSEEEAEQVVVELRLEKFKDIDHQLTEENQRSCFGDVRRERLTLIPKDPEEYRKVMAFREHIGENVWRVLGGDRVNHRLLAMAIDYIYKS